MGLSVVTGPTSEPVTLSEAKAHCRIDISEDDGLLAGYILAARIFIEGETHRSIASKTYDYTIDYGWPKRGCSDWIELPVSPLVSVSSITYVNENGATQTLASNQYRVLTNRPRGVVIPAYDAVWPTVRYQPETITIRFVAGYSNVPNDLCTALLMLVAHWYENRETVNAGSTTELPFTVQSIISGYRS